MASYHNKKRRGRPRKELAEDHPDFEPPKGEFEVPTAPFQRRFCSYILRGATVSSAASLTRVHPVTAERWLARGLREPTTIFGEFRRYYEDVLLKANQPLLDQLRALAASGDQKAIKYLLEYDPRRNEARTREQLLAATVEKTKEDTRLIKARTKQVEAGIGVDSPQQIVVHIPSYELPRAAQPALEAHIVDDKEGVDT